MAPNSMLNSVARTFDTARKLIFGASVQLRSRVQFGVFKV